VWWGDERFVGADDPDRNEGQAQHALLRHAPIPEENIHRMGSSDDFANAEDAASSYSADAAAHGRPTWDVVMLGMGPDGHVASLFPSHPVYITADTVEAVAVHDSPKAPPTRVSMTLATINRAREVWIVAAGASKADVAARGFAGDLSLPVAAVEGTERTLWLLDAAASTLF